MYLNYCPILLLEEEKNLISEEITFFFFLLGKNGCRILHIHLKETESFFEFNKPHREKHVSVRKNKTRSHDNGQET